MAGKIAKTAKKVISKAVQKVRRKPTKDEAAVEKMGLTSTRTGGGSKLTGANLLQANRNPKQARAENKRINKPTKKVSKKKK